MYCPVQKSLSAKDYKSETYCFKYTTVVSYQTLDFEFDRPVTCIAYNMQYFTAKVVALTHMYVCTCVCGLCCVRK